MKDITKYKPLLTKLASKFDSRHKEDLIQEGYLLILQQKDKYDSSIGSFETFIYKKLYYMMLDYVNTENQYSSLDDQIFDDGDLYTKADLIEDELDLDNDYTNQDYYEQNLENCNSIERFIKKRHFEEGMTAEEIVDLYSEYTNIRDIRKINKIIKK